MKNFTSLNPGKRDPGKQATSHKPQATSHTTRNETPT